MTQENNKNKSINDKKEKLVFDIDVNEVVVYLEKVLIEPQDHLHLCLAHSQAESSVSVAEQADIKRITSVNVLSKRQMVDLLIVCDNGHPQRLTIPEEVESKFSVGSLIIDYNGRVEPYQKPKYIN